MGSKPSQPQTAELFRPRLDEQIKMNHPLVKLAALIDWAEIERTFAGAFTSGRGRPALPPRLVAASGLSATARTIPQVARAL